MSNQSSNHPAARQFAIEVVKRLTEAGYTALWAGGCVRDLLTGSEPKDYDVATDAHPHQVREVFGRRRTLAVGESFGVIIVLGSTKTAGQVEVATFRTDGNYSDGRRPDSVQFATAPEDAQRRDFTINGMFYDPVSDTVLDYVDGQRDLGLKIIRAIGDPAARIAEDKLRMLRAVRFAARFDFQLEDNTAQEIRRHCDQIRVVSPERITDELRKIMRHPTRDTAFMLLHECQLLKPILPDLFPVHENERTFGQTIDMLARLPHASFEQSLAIAFRHWGEMQPGQTTSQLQRLCQQLRLSNHEARDITWLIENRVAIQRANELSLAQLKVLLAHPLAPDLLDLTGTIASCLDQSTAAIEYARRYRLESSADTLNPDPLVTGGDLIAAGFRPGPQFSKWLETIRTAQLNQELDSKQEALKMLQKLAASQ